MRIKEAKFRANFGLESANSKCGDMAIKNIKRAASAHFLSRVMKKKDIIVLCR